MLPPTIFVMGEDAISSATAMAKDPQELNIALLMLLFGLLSLTTMLPSFICC